MYWTGIGSWVNFTPLTLRMPESIHLKNIDLACTMRQAPGIWHWERGRESGEASEASRAQNSMTCSLSGQCQCRIST